MQPKRIDKALSSIIVESYIKGVSTRKVESIVGELGIDLSYEIVSRLSHELDEVVTEFKTSPLQEYYPYLYIDATYLKVFDGVRFVSSAVMVVIGVDATGRREILAIDTNAKWLNRNYVSFDNLVQCQKAEDEFTEIF